MNCVNNQINFYGLVSSSCVAKADSPYQARIQPADGNLNDGYL